MCIRDRYHNDEENMPEFTEDFPAFSGDYCITSTNRVFGWRPAMANNCKFDHSWLEIGVYLKLMGGDLEEIPGTMEQRLPLCSRRNSKPVGRPALRAYKFETKDVMIST